MTTLSVLVLFRLWTTDYNNANFSEAINYYKKSLKLYHSYPNILIDAKISLIDTYLQLNDYSNAKKQSETVNVDNLSVQSTTKYKSYLMSVSSELK